MECFLVTTRKRSLGKVIFLHLSVILFTGVEYPGRYPLAGTPPRQVPPSSRYTPTGTPHWQVPPGQVPPSGSACWDTVNKRAVCILLKIYLQVLDVTLHLLNKYYRTIVTDSKN